MIKYFILLEHEIGNENNKKILADVIIYENDTNETDKTVVNWRGKYNSIVVWDSFDEFLEISVRGINRKVEFVYMSKL